MSMLDFLQSIFGTYSPVTYIDYIFNPNLEQLVPVTRVADGLAGVDWLFIFNALIFVLSVYSVFRLLGAFISRRW